MRTHFTILALHQCQILIRTNLFTISEIDILDLQTDNCLLCFSTFFHFPQTWQPYFATVDNHLLISVLTVFHSALSFLYLKEKSGCPFLYLPLAYNCLIGLTFFNSFVLLLILADRLFNCFSSITVSKDCVSSV